MEDKRPDSHQYLPGGQALRIVQATVDKVLLPKGLKRRVSTREEGFFNVDNWPLIHLAKELCQRSEKNPLTLRVVEDSIIAANSTNVKPYINIEMRGNTSQKQLKDYIGIAYHETFHTLYDTLDPVPMSDAENILHFVGTEVKWAPYHSLISFWHNEFCDVKIEQFGQIEYPECRKYLRETHRSRVRRLRDTLKKSGIDVLNAAAAAFRHYAFEYQDGVAESFLKEVRKAHPKIVELFAPGGRFHSYAIAAKSQRDHNVLRAMELTFLLLDDLRKVAPEISDKGDIFYRDQQKQGWGHCRIDPPSILDMMFLCSGVRTEDGLQVSADKNPNRDEQLSCKHEIIHVGKGMKASQYVQESFQMIQETRRQIGYYKSRLRTKIKALEVVQDIHGIDNGVDISDECLVDIKIDLASGTHPSDFEWEKGEGVDTSTSAYMLLDLSGSMSGEIRDACKVVLSLMDPLETLRCSTMASGFESSGWGNNSTTNHHIIKHWDDNYRNTRWRFALAEAHGGTPMAEGMQFAFNALQSRKEGNRLLFVITDGCPNGGQEQIRELIKVGEEAGIITIGIGFGSGAQYVKTLFPSGCSVWEENVEELPPQVVKMLLKKMSPKKRGRLLKRQVLPRSA